MNKLAYFQDGIKDCYSINKPKSFKGAEIEKSFVKSAFEFAYGMTFGGQGQHRDHRSGGSNYRKNGELFCNTFQGKLAEFAVYQSIVSEGIKTELPDVGMWELGRWDDTDLTLNNLKLSIKSAAYFSNLLLLETPDWDENGYYIPNRSSVGGKYDFIVLVRLNPDVKGILTSNRLYYNNECPVEVLWAIIQKAAWQFDIAGCIDHATLCAIIKEKQILPKGSYLNGKTKMDAENYYCQAGDMLNFSQILKMLNYATC